MIKRLLLVLAALLVALAGHAPASEPLYINPSHVTVRVRAETTIRLIPQGQHSVSWDVSRGHCYARQMASAHIHGWRKEHGYYYFPVTIYGWYPGFCEMWFKSTSGAEAKLSVFVER